MIQHQNNRALVLPAILLCTMVSATVILFSANMNVENKAIILPPPTPTLTMITGSPSTATDVSMSWTSSPGATIYRVFRYTEPITWANWDTQAIQITSTSGLTHTSSTSGLGISYYAVVAFNSDGDPSDPSNSPFVIRTAVIKTAPVLTTSAPPFIVGSSITLTSSDVAATTYYLFRHTSAITSANVGYSTMVASQSSRTFSVSMPIGTYYFSVVAKIGADYSSVSNSPAVIVQAAPPSAPTLTIDTPQSLKGRTISLSWTASTGAASYSLYRHSAAITAENIVPAMLVASGLTGTTTTNVVPSGGTYYYAVTAVSATGPSLPSNSPSIVVLKVPNTPVLTITTASPVKIRPPGYVWVSLSWTASPGATNYYIYIHTAAITPANIAPSMLWTTVLGGISISFVVYKWGTVYFAMTAKNATGESDPSNSPSIFVEVYPSAPTLTIVTSPAIRNMPITLTWTASPGATSYKVYKHTAAITTGNIVPAMLVESGLTLLTTTITISTIGLNYFAVVAVNATGDSIPSNSPGIAVQDLPSAPALLTINTPSPSASLTVSLSWTASPGATSYKLYRHTDAITAGNIAPAMLMASGLTALSTTNAVPGNGQYYFAVVAVNSTGSSLPSNSPSIVVLLAPLPPTITIETVSPTISLSISLSWSAPTGAASYNLYRRPVPITTENIGSLTPVATGLTGTTTTNVVPRVGTYYYAIIALNAAGISGPSNSPYITVLSVPEDPSLSIDSTSPTADTTILLSWSPSTGATSYTVYRHDVAITPANIDDATEVAITPSIATIDIVPAIGTYYYAVVATNVISSSGPSNSPSIVVQAGVDPPAAPVMSITNPSPTTSTSISLSWTTIPGDVSYAVYRYTSAITVENIASVSFITTTYGTTTSDIVPRLGTYYYAVVAISSTGVSLPSNSPSISVQALPSAPTLTITTTPKPTTSTTISLSWTASPGATSYKLYRHSAAITSGNIGSLTPVATGLTGTTTTNTAPGVGTYYYAVTATNATGSSAPSNSPSIVVVQLNILLSISPASPTTSFVMSLSWTAHVGATGYKVYRHSATITPANIASAMLVTTVVTTSTTDTVPHVGVYYYAVVATTSGGDSLPSNSPSISVQALPTAPTLTIDTPSPSASKTISLSWTASPGATSYSLYRHSAAITPGNVGSAMVVTVTASLSATNVVPLVGVYYYAVVASNATGSSSPSNSPSISVVAVTAMPQAPSMTIVTPSPTASKTIQISWTASPGATSYKLYRHSIAITPGNVGSLTPVATGLTGTSTTNTVMTVGTYYYAVVAVNATGSSVPSNSPSIIVSSLPSPPVLSMNTATPSTGTAVSLSWTASAGATSYKVYRHGSAINATSISSATLVQTIAGLSITDAVTASGKYYYAVVAVNATGASAPSNSPYIDVQLGTPSVLDQMVAFITGLFTTIVSFFLGLLGLALVRNKRAGGSKCDGIGECSI